MRIFSARQQSVSNAPASQGHVWGSEPEAGERSGNSRGEAIMSWIYKDQITKDRYIMSTRYNERVRVIWKQGERERLSNKKSSAKEETMGQKATEAQRTEARRPECDPFCLTVQA